MVPAGSSNFSFSATVRRIRSPMAWPWASFICLKRSRIDRDDAARPAFLDALHEPRLQHVAIGQAGEHVVMRQERHALLRLLALADVAHFEQAPRRTGVVDGACADLDFDGRAVASM